MTGTAPARPRDCRLEVWIPGADRPVPASSGITGLRVRRLPGGWQISGCAGGAYRLEVSRQ
jgi:endoglycosylceramidase